MGSVALVEQAIINEMHAIDYVVPDRRSDDLLDNFFGDTDLVDDDDDEPAPVAEGHTPVVGAYVARPKIGLQNHVGAVDIKSLYPSAIRALNMSPETLLGQVRLDETMRLVSSRLAKLSKTQRAEAWDGLFCTCEVQHMHDQDDTVVTVDFFDHLHDTTTTVEMTGKALHEFVFDPNNQVCISANGTIFRTDVAGIIPTLLAKWYAERESMQAKQRLYEQMSAGVEIDEELARLLAEP
jgi:DNA polymerase elongation subunit (family B)